MAYRDAMVKGGVKKDSPLLQAIDHKLGLVEDRPAVQKNYEASLKDPAFKEFMLEMARASGGIDTRDKFAGAAASGAGADIAANVDYFRSGKVIKDLRDDAFGILGPDKAADYLSGNRQEVIRDYVEQKLHSSFGADNIIVSKGPRGNIVWKLKLDERTAAAFPTNKIGDVVVIYEE